MFNTEKLQLTATEFEMVIILAADRSTSEVAAEFLRKRFRLPKTNAVKMVQAWSDERLREPKR